jgi:lipoprotein-releasing system ATP-binding protein
MLEIQHINKSYGSLKVLDDVSLRVETGDLIGIVGKSGAGKSTLLHIAGTLDTADSGKVILKDKEITSLKGNDLSDFRNKFVGFIFQFHHLLPEFSALENVMIPALIARSNQSLARKKAMELLDAVGLSDRAEHKPSALSGGEQQRVAIARALINEPAIIFADEPTGNLDSASSEEVHQLFLRLNHDLNQTFIIVTHNENLADICHRTVKMADGKIINP